MTDARTAHRPGGLERFQALWPLLFSFLVVASLYVWQASKHPTPWLFSDEIEYAQISRAIAETGKPARRGVEYWGTGLFPWLIAPFWWIDNLQTAYGAVKTFNVLVMTAAMFPTYALARMLMARPYALLAAVAACVSPSFIYSAMVMQEPAAYLTAATAFYVATRALAHPTRGSIAVAAAVGLVAPFVRDELIVVPALMLGAALVQYAWIGGGRRLVDRASIGAKIGLGLAVAGAVAVALVVVRAGSGQVEIAFRSPGTMLDQALWAWGALVVGLGVLPAVIGLTMLLPAQVAPRTRVRISFSAVLAASVALFTTYVAVKGSYQAAVFEPRVSERNLVYLVPLLSVAVALFAATRAVRIPVLAAAGAFVVWTIASVPIRIGQGLEGDAPGLAILSRLNHDHGLSLDGAHRLLYGLAAASIVVGLVPTLVRRRLSTYVVLAGALLSIGWSVRAETVASTYSNEFSQLFFRNLPQPVGWVDDSTLGQPAVYIGQKIADPNGIWSMEFWNRDVRKVWSLDGSAPGPGPTLTPNIESTDGQLVGDPGYHYAVVDNGISIAGETVVERGLLRLVRIAPPLRLTQSLAGVFNDGWVGSSRQVDSVSADYNRFDAPQTPGTVFVTLSREAFCGPKAPGSVLIEVGTLGLGDQRDGIIDRVTQRRGWVVDSCARRTFPIPTPGGPFHVRVTVTPPFQPATLDPGNFERRYFGAQLGIQFEPGS